MLHLKDILPGDLILARRVGDKVDHYLLFLEISKNKFNDNYTGTILEISSTTGQVYYKLKDLLPTQSFYIKKI